VGDGGPQPEPGTAGRGQGQVRVAVPGVQRGVGEPEVAEAEALDLADPVAELARRVHSLQDHARSRSGHALPLPRHGATTTPRAPSGSMSAGARPAPASTARESEPSAGAGAG